VTGRDPVGSSVLRRTLLPALPASRVAALRAIVAVFVLVDIVVIDGDVPGHAANAEYFRPMLLARLLHLPPVTEAGAHVLQTVIVLGCVLGLLGWRPRRTGAVVGVAFGVWMLYSNSYGYIAHDHLALMVAVWVLPSVPAASWRDDTPSEAAGWALRCIQLAVVATYFLSVLAKILASGSVAAWADSAILAWAIIRRGTPWAAWLLHVPWVFVPAQWAAVAMELSSPLALFLRGRALYVLIAVFLGFHLSTFLLLGIHVLPTAVCWAAFVPVERLRDTRAGRRLARLTAPVRPRTVSRAV